MTAWIARRWPWIAALLVVVGLVAWGALERAGRAEAERRADAATQRADAAVTRAELAERSAEREREVTRAHMQIAAERDAQLADLEEHTRADHAAVAGELEAIDREVLDKGSAADAMNRAFGASP